MDKLFSKAYGLHHRAYHGVDSGVPVAMRFVCGTFILSSKKVIKVRLR